MLHSFSWMTLDINYRLFSDLYQEIGDLDRYFYKFNRLNAEEAKSRTLLHVMTHYDSTGSKDLRPYIKKLAREIMKDGYKDIPVDFLEQTVVEDEETVDQGYLKQQHKTPDFTDEVLATIVDSKSRYSAIVGVALVSMRWFLLLCECLENGGSIQATYFPVEFKKACLAIAQNYRAFNADCAAIYERHGAEMRQFMQYEKFRPTSWSESNYSVENGRKYRKGNLVAKDGSDLYNIDLQEFKFVGTLNQSARIYRVYFDKILDILFELVFSPTSNCIKCVIGENYIVRTIGGSWSILNPDLDTESDLLRCELLTNILLETNGKLLSCGSDSVIIVTPGELCIKQGRCYCGINLDFIYKDITDELV